MTKKKLNQWSIGDMYSNIIISLYIHFVYSLASGAISMRTKKYTSLTVPCQGCHYPIFFLCLWLSKLLSIESMPAQTSYLKSLFLLYYLNNLPFVSRLQVNLLFPAKLFGVMCVINPHGIDRSE